MVDDIPTTRRLQDAVSIRKWILQAEYVSRCRLNSRGPLDGEALSCVSHSMSRQLSLSITAQRDGRTCS